MYTVQTKTKILSVHATQMGALKALEAHVKKDLVGYHAFVTNVPWSNLLMPVLTVLVFAGLGALAAWRG